MNSQLESQASLVRRLASAHSATSTKQRDTQPTNQDSLPANSQTGLPTLTAARQAAERGMTLALDKAERQEPGWASDAFNFLKRYAAREPRFAGFMVVASSNLDKTFPQPQNGDKAWGKIFTKAADDGLIRKTEQFVPHPKRHGCPAMVWESLICERARAMA